MSTAREYVAKGWGVVPLPRRQKETPPIGFTGRAGKIADDEDLTNWLNDAQFSEGNIALRLGNLLVINGIRYEVIGIDVDAHSGKPGAKELERLEAKFGKLPATWTSSSRVDGISGIRFYLVPYGYGYKGNASTSIDIIQRVHRYAVCYPSWHPSTKSQYFWYPPGEALDGQGFSLEIPEAQSLTVLTDEWINYLTRNRMADEDFGDGRYGIDLDVSTDELFAWVTKKFNPPLADEAGGQCKVIRDAVAKHVDTINTTVSNHDTLVAAHWHILHLVSEGHSGYETAIDEINSVWSKDVAAKGKRPLDVVRRELKRSFEGTLRKIKAKADSLALQKVSFFSPEMCMTDDISIKVKSPEWIMSVPLRFKDFDPIHYEKNDVGQAQHFFDRVADNVRYLADYNGWIIYDGITWHLDDFAHVRNLFDRACIQTSLKRILGLLKKMQTYQSAAGNSKSDDAYKKMDGQVKRLYAIADTYRNDNKIKAALNCMKSIPGVAMRFNELNWDTTILAMPNGKCLRLDEPTSKPDPKALGFNVIDNDKSFFTTMSTAVQYKPFKQISVDERDKWANYLDLFLPDKGYRKFVQKVLGHILIGGNPEKLAIFLVGKRHTGKTTMINAIMACLKDYGETFQPNAFFKDGASTNPELGNLLHKRGIFSSESGSQQINANSLKRNTGGDKISITRKYANSQIIAVPHCVSVVATNASPTINDADEALIKRILVCPFDIQVTPENDDKRADITIPRDAQHAVFSWLVMGYRLYIREGLGYSEWPDIVKLRVKEFAAELSDVATFLNEMCIAAEDDVRIELNRDIISASHEKLRTEWGKVSAAKLYEAYLRECEGSQQKPMIKGRFGKKVKQVFGIESKTVKTQGNVIRMYIGLKWRDEEAMNQIGSSR